MSSTLQSAEVQCCSTCKDPVEVNVPGPQGPAGAACTPCTDGQNAFTTIVGGTTIVPAYGDTVTVEFVSTAWMAYGQVIFLGPLDISGPTVYGYYLVNAVTDSTHASITNLGYTGNLNGNGIIEFAAGTRVQPGGLQGPSGSASGAAFLIANNLSEGDPATMRTNLGLGTAATEAAGSFFAVANNLSEGVGATKRANLGLGTAAVLNSGVSNGNLPPIDTTFTNGDAVFATATGLQTKTAADALVALGITGGLVGSYALLQNQQVPSTDGGTFTSGSWVVVPINTEVSDAGGIVTLAGNVATLQTGNYRVRVTIPAYKVDRFQTRLFNVSDAIVECYGSSALAGAAIDVTAESLLEFRLVVSAGPKNYRIEAQCATTNSGDGFGTANGFGGTEVYGSWVIEKEV